MFRTKATFLVVCLSILAMGSTAVSGQGMKTDLKDKKITIQMTNKPLETVFARLMFKYDVAIGFEESTFDQDHRQYEFETNVPWTDPLKTDYAGDKEYHGSLTKTREHLITVNFTDTTLETVMDEIVTQMQHYDWEIDTDIVNIFPIRGRDERLKKLLNIDIHDFAVGKGADIDSIQASLMRFLPEFKKFLVDNDLEGEPWRGTFNFGNRILPDGMRFFDMKFKDLLNTITKSKRGGWIIKIKKYSNRPNKEFVEILI